MKPTDELRSLAEEFRAPAKKAKRFLRKAGKAGPSKRQQAARRFAQLAFDAASGDGVLEIFEHILDEFSDDQSIRRSYATALAACGRDPEAIAEAEECLRVEPDDADTLTFVAPLYARSGRTDLAVERLRRAIDLYVAADRLDAAVAAARVLITLEPQSLEHASDLVGILRARDPVLLAEAVEHLANVYRDRQKLGQEAEACRELLALSPEREDVKRRLAAIYTRILDVDPDDADAWFGLATVDEVLADQLRVLLLREDGEADGPAPLAAALDPHEEYASRKAQELMDAGDMLGASLCLERAIRTGGDPNNHLRLAQCYLAIHREPEAIREVLRAAALAQASGNARIVDAAVAWVAGVHPGREVDVAEVVSLNSRPESADMLYEQLLDRWDVLDDAAGVGAIGEAE